MRFISLDRHCDIAYNIKKYTNDEYPRNFFDWLRTDFKCVLEILNVKNIDDIFNKNSIILDREMFKQNADLTLFLNYFQSQNLTLLFRHEIKLSEYNEVNSDQLLTKFIDKYKRRYNRLIELIKSTEVLYFIHRVADCDDNYDVQYDDILQFDKILKSINPNIKYKLVLLNPKIDDDEYVQNDNLIIINLSKLTDHNIEHDWTNQHYNWNRIFEIITQFG